MIGNTSASGPVLEAIRFAEAGDRCEPYRLRITTSSGREYCGIVAGTSASIARTGAIRLQSLADHPSDPDEVVLALDKIEAVRVEFF